MNPSGAPFKAMFNPILLQTRILSVANLQARTIQDESQLRNRLNTPMLLDEIRVMSSSVSTAPYDVFIKLDMGRIPLTNGYVPIGLLGLQMDPTGIAGPNVFVSSGLAPLTWKLPKPLFVPAGEYVRPHIMYDALNAANAVTSDYYVTYVGRSLPKNFIVPKTVPMPWVCAFKTDRRTANGVYLSESTEADLNNPFDVPLFVQRFMGIVDNNSGESQVTGPIYDVTQARASDSAGKILIRDPTDMDVLFIGNGHAWPVNSVLPSKGFYRFVIEQDYSAAAGIEFSEGSVLRSLVTMVGSREVKMEGGI